MKYDSLLQILGDEVLFETGLLLAGDVDPNDVQRQLSRWVDQGRVLGAVGDSYYELVTAWCIDPKVLVPLAVERGNGAIKLVQIPAKYQVTLLPSSKDRRQQHFLG